MLERIPLLGEFLKIRERARVRTESIRFLIFTALHLKISPNLEEAVRFGVKNCSDDLFLKRIENHLKNYFLGKETLEQSLHSFFEKEGLGEFHQILNLLRSSVEVDDECRGEVLDSSIEALLESFRDELSSFSSRLPSQLMLLYSICVIFPLLLLPSLPALSLFGLNFGVIGISALFIFSLLLYYLAVCYITAASPISQEGLRSDPLFLLALSPVPLSFFLEGESRTWFLIWAPALLLSFALWYRSRACLQELKKELEMEKELPEVLRQLGGRMSRGVPLEDAFEGLRGGELSALLRKTTNLVRFGGMEIGLAMFDPQYGVLTKLRSEKIKSTMGLVVSLAGKNLALCGEALRWFSNHLKKIENIEKETKRFLSSILSSMRSLAVIFGPAVLSIVARMVILLNYRGFIFLSMGPETFLLINGLFSLGLSAVLVLSSSKLEGARCCMQQHLLAKGLLLTALFYTLFSFLGLRLTEVLTS